MSSVYPRDRQSPGWDSPSRPSWKSSRTRRFACWSLLVIAVFSVGNAARAGVIYVDNLQGSDQFDGSTVRPLGVSSGPVKTLGRALLLARHGDTIFLTNTGQPYIGSLSLVGARFSGEPGFPFTIQGNGATLTSWQPVPSAGWQKAGSQLWSLQLTRKGFYSFSRNGEHLTEFPLGPETGLDDLPGGLWAASQGKVYYRQADFYEPAEFEFGYASAQTGISLHQVRHVLLSDLVIEYFRYDGIHVQNDCQDIRLDRVILRYNGRAGLAASGAVDVQLKDSQISENGRASLLVDRPARVTVETTDLDVEPIVR